MTRTHHRKSCALASTLLLVAGLFGASPVAQAAYSTGINFFINAQTGLCAAQFQTVDLNQTHLSSGTPTIRITKNRNMINATCHFSDTSPIGAERGESITEATCTITEADGGVHVGLGRGTSANNDAGAPGSTDGAGRTTIKCQASS